MSKLQIAPVQTPVSADAITFSQPTVADGAAIWQLVKDTGVLDLNSSYYYLILCKYHADTCIVAKHNDKLVGFVTGYIPPEQPRDYFLWQVGVDAAARGQGLARRMVLKLLQRSILQQVEYIETTVTPSNIPSRRLFQSLSRHLETELTIGEGFGTELFPEGATHEAEDGFRVGPFNTDVLEGVTV